MKILRTLPCLFGILPFALHAGEHRADMIAGHRTIHGAEVSQRPNPIPVREVYGEDRDWQKQPFRLAVLLIEFSDTKHDPAHDSAFYQKLVFGSGESEKTTSKDATFYSLAGWYAAQSHDRFALGGQVFDWVQIAETYEDVHAMTRKDAEEKYFRAAQSKLKECNGARFLEGFDGWFFIHAGPIAGPSTNVLWSHRWTLDGMRYLTTYETQTINVACHEFGHMLGLPDLYGKKDVRESFGPWCAMAAGYRGEMPGSFCVWSKARLGWCQPAVIDVGTAQKLMLRPIQTHPHDAFLIPLNPHDGIGTEFLLLENRAGILNDTGRQAGLFIWRIKRKTDQNSSPVFELSLPGPDAAARVQLRDRRVAWPSATSSIYRLPGTVEHEGVTIQNIRQEAGGMFFEVVPSKPD